MVGHLATTLADLGHTSTHAARVVNVPRAHTLPVSRGTNSEKPFVRAVKGDKAAVRHLSSHEL